MDIKIGSNAIYTTTTPSLNYKIVVGGVTIYRGRALSAPNGKISINVSQIVEDYLNSDEFPKRNINPILYSEAGGYIQTYLYRVGEEGSDTLLAQYNFLRSYDDDWQAGVYDSRQEVWTGQSITMSNPVNGRLDPRMQFLYTVYRKTSGETISWGIVPKFRIVPNPVIVSPDGGTYSLMIESNVPFTATTEYGWITLRGSEPNYTLDISENTENDRTGGITLTYLDENDVQQTLTIPVVQAGAEISIIPSSISFGPDGGESRFTVLSNFEVTPTATADWFTFEPVRTGDGFVTYKIVAASNRESTSGRTAYVSVRGETMTVTQDAFTVTVEVDKTEYSGEGDEGTLTVTANGYYEITTDVEWIRVSPSVGYSGITNFTIEVDENDSETGRTGHIIIGGTSIEITQEKQAFISINPMSWTFPAVGGSKVFQISDRHNHGWKFVATSGVLALLSQTGGTGNAEVTMTVGPANTSNVTTYVLKLEDETTGEQIVPSIRRAAPVITVTPSTFNIAASGGTGSFTVYSEVNYTLNQFASDGDWITLSATGGTAGTTTFNFTADTTTSQYQRTGYVRVFSTRKITFVQEAAGAEFSYLTFDIISGGTITWRKNAYGSSKTISYSVDSGSTWTDLNSTNATTFYVSVGDSVIFKGVNDAYGGTQAVNNFSGSTAYFNVRGNIMSMIYGDNFSGRTELTSGHTFDYFFSGTNVIESRGLVLPATALTSNCYRRMFWGCSSLTSAPSLPATTLAGSCYSHMFSKCTSLISAPELPATTLVAYCYEAMFAESAIVTAPSLPATTLAGFCYQNMFKRCTSLINAPELPATVLYSACYRQMFEGCTSLTTPLLLPSATLEEECYRSMFQDCTSLNYIKCLATDISAAKCTRDWVTGVAQSGTFVKKSGVSWETGDSGIPSGWTVQEE
ncbi:BACON domain-containing protein [Fibrobacter sp.]|uniref:BACON domain-containing protein n=1 Tax=Fibrobacter sp. TaxID=35828 RepID=UPI003870A33E